MVFSLLLKLASGPVTISKLVSYCAQSSVCNGRDAIRRSSQAISEHVPLRDELAVPSDVLSAMVLRSRGKGRAAPSITVLSTIRDLDVMLTV